MNINSMRNKFYSLLDQVNANADALMVTETKLDQFPADLVTFTEEILNGKLHFLCSVTANFLFQVIRQPDRNLAGCGIMLSMTESTPSKLPRAEPLPMEAFFKN